LNNIQIEVPKNFERILINDYKSKFNKFKVEIEDRELSLIKVNKYKIFDLSKRKVNLIYKDNKYLNDIVVIDPMLSQDSIVIDLTITLKYKDDEKSKGWHKSTI